MMACGWGRLVAFLAGVAIRADVSLLIGVVATTNILAIQTAVLHVSILLPAAFLPFGLLDFRLKVLDAAEPHFGLAQFLCPISIAGFALIWSLGSSPRYFLLESGQLHVWLDNFIHAGTIAQFGDIRMAGHGSSGLADALPVHHH